MTEVEQLPNREIEEWLALLSLEAERAEQHAAMTRKRGR